MGTWSEHVGNKGKMKKSSPPANPKLKRKINQGTLNVMLSLPIGCMKKPALLLAFPSAIFFLSSLVVSHHRILFPRLFHCSTSFLKSKPKDIKGRIIDKVQRKQETFSGSRVTKKKSGARIIAAISVSFTKVQDFSKSQYTCATRG